MQAFAFAPRQITASAPHRSLGVVQGAAAGARLPHVSMRQLVLVRTGDEAARQELLETWLPLVGQEARRYARTGGPEEELAQEGALALWEAALQYDPQRHRTAPERYLHNAIHRRVRRDYREAMGYAGEKLVPVETLEQEKVSEAGYGAAERHADLAGALAALKPAEREQFEQYLGLALAGMGPDEAARAMASQAGGSFAANKKRLERIRRRVKERLSP
jgi:RNA polymerase sigma factor (sigma-70 family)